MGNTTMDQRIARDLILLQKPIPMTRAKIDEQLEDSPFKKWPTFAEDVEYFRSNNYEPLHAMFLVRASITWHWLDKVEQHILTGIGNKPHATLSQADKDVYSRVFTKVNEEFERWVANTPAE